MPGPKDALSYVDEFDKLDGSDYGDQNIEDAGPDDNDAPDAGDSVSADNDASEQPSRQTRQTERAERTTDTKTSEQKQQPQTPELRPLQGDFAQDKEGNLYNRSGTLLAKAGSERRLYERSIRQQNELVQREQTIQQLQEQLRTSMNVPDEARRMGIDSEDMRVGLPIIAEFKRDPVKAARNVLEMVMGMGHNLSDILGASAKDAVEMGAISRLLDERLAPLQQITQRDQQQQREAQIRQEAEREIARFVDEHEHASIHLREIDNLIGRRPELSPEKAYYELRLFATQHGLDFSKPLAPQLQERQAGARNDDDFEDRQQTRDVPAMPNGSRGVRSAPMAEAAELEPTSSWEDIIRRSMQLSRRQ